MMSKTQKGWTTANFAKMLGYEPWSMTLAKVWMVWNMRFGEDTNRILHSILNWGSHTIFLKKWRVEFNTKYEKIQMIHVWVRFLGLSLILWFDEVFGEIGNALVFFL
jgi:hypothetical protein